MRRAGVLAVGVAFAMSSCSYCEEGDIPCEIERSGNSPSGEMIFGLVMFVFIVLGLFALVRWLQKSLLLARASTKRLISNLESDGWSVNVERTDLGVAESLFRIVPIWCVRVTFSPPCAKHYAFSDQTPGYRGYIVAEGTWRGLGQEKMPSENPRNCPDCGKYLSRPKSQSPET